MKKIENARLSSLVENTFRKIKRKNLIVIQIPLLKTV